MKKGRKCESIIDAYLARPISHQFSKFLAKTNITPNQVTSMGIISFVIASILFLFGKYSYLFSGAILLIFSYIFDLCDGEVARIKNMRSDFGNWYDDVGDRFKEYIVPVTLAVGYFLNNNDTSILIIAMLCIGGNLFTRYIRVSILCFLPNSKNKPMVVLYKSKKKEIYFGTTALFEVLNISLILLNQVYTLLVFSAIIGNVSWILKVIQGFKLKKNNLKIKEELHNG